MLIEFSFSNFRSFKDLTTLSMVAANIASKDKELDSQNVFPVDSKLNLLKSKAIYGKNASGKSNISRALAAFLNIVRYSVKNDDILIKTIEPFRLNSTTPDEPSFFQIIFQISGEASIYRYGFEVKGNKVISEWLFGKNGREGGPYFTREGMEVNVHNRFREAKKFEGLTRSGDNEIFRDNSLFLVAVSAMGGMVAKRIVDAMSEVAVVSGLEDPRIKGTLQKILQDKSTRESILELVRAADIDIEDIEPLDLDESQQVLPEDMPDELKELVRQGRIIKSPDFITKRSVFNSNGERVSTLSSSFEEWESEGTKKILQLSPFLLRTLTRGSTLVIDEFDARLHPLLAQKIIQLFNSKEANPKGAQLIFVTHDTNFLKSSLLRRDQVCFVDKDEFGVSTLRTLVEYKGVRNDASYDKDYLGGKYGAVPFLNRLNHIFEH